MASAIPKSPYPKSSTYDHETDIAGDFTNLSRFFMTKAIRASLSSPPLAKDIGELQLVYDKTANRLYTKIDGSLKYVAFT